MLIVVSGAAPPCGNLCTIEHNTRQEGFFFVFFVTVKPVVLAVWPGNLVAGPDSKGASGSAAPFAVPACPTFFTRAAP